MHIRRKKLILFSIVLAIVFLIVTYYSNSGVVNKEMHSTKQYATWAFLLGILGGGSLIIGSLIGANFHPKPSLTAGLSAFGGGAMLAALSIELIAPTVMGIVEHPVESKIPAIENKEIDLSMLSLIIGCIAGGVIYILFDELLSTKGGFLRKMSTLITHIGQTSLHKVKNQIEDDKHILDHHEIKKELEEHGEGSPLSIWLGMLIDGIPESFVIGAGFLSLLALKIGNGIIPSFGEVIPYTLIAGMALSNFPESLSSSVALRKQGMSKTSIVLLWGSQVLITGIGTLAGYYLGTMVSHEVEIAIEGLAAGAMLTMIAQTMIPEAVHIGGGKIVGISTLAGYLAAISFKLLE